MADGCLSQSLVLPESLPVKRPFFLLTVAKSLAYNIKHIEATQVRAIIGNSYGNHECLDQERRQSIKKSWFCGRENWDGIRG